MSYIFKKQLVDVDKIKLSKPDYSIPAYLDVNTHQYLTIHETDNTDLGADAQAHADLQSNGYSEAWQYQSDDKQVIQSWEDDISCYHAGDGSSNNGLGSKTSVALEICVNEGINVAKSRSIAEEFAADWLFKNGHDVDHIRLHKDWSGKKCPDTIITEGYFPKFKENVQTYLKRLSGTEDSMANNQLVSAQGSKIPAGTYAAYLQMAAAFKKATGYDLLITDAYRTYTQQKSLYDRWKAGTFKAPSVARPGTSLHETGRALDLRDSGNSPGVTVAGNARSNWIRSNSRKYGFEPAGYGFNEPWHVEYLGNVWAASTASSGTNYNPNGYSASYVKDVQKKLSALGYSIGSSGADGILGKDTFNAIKAFQKSKGLVVDGIPGANTLKAMSTKSPVKAVQTAVRANQDGISGADTKKRVDAVRKASSFGGKQFPYGVKYTQQVVGATQDNVWGQKSKDAHDRTVVAIQKAVGVNPDGIWGVATEKAVTNVIGR